MNDKKAEILREIIAWCEQCSKAAQDAVAISNRKGHFDTGAWHHGRMTAFNEIEKQCKAMLGHGGTMLLLKDENQAEDAK